MGRESREREEQEAVGRYNVKITLLYYNEILDVINQEILFCKQWIHTGPFLALTLFNGTVKIICLQQYQGFEINSIDPETLVSLNEESTLKN